MFKPVSKPYSNEIEIRLNPVFPGHALHEKGFPGHTLHEKGSQRQVGVGKLVSSQEQRALLVPVMNRG